MEMSDKASKTKTIRQGIAIVGLLTAFVVIKKLKAEWEWKISQQNLNELSVLLGWRESLLASNSKTH